MSSPGSRTLQPNPFLPKMTFGMPVQAVGMPFYGGFMSPPRYPPPSSTITSVESEATEIFPPLPDEPPPPPPASETTHWRLYFILIHWLRNKRVKLNDVPFVWKLLFGYDKKLIWRRTLQSGDKSFCLSMGFHFLLNSVYDIYWNHWSFTCNSRSRVLVGIIWYRFDNTD